MMIAEGQNLRKRRERLKVFDLEGNYLRTEYRDQYYENIKREFAETGKITTQVKAIRLLVLNSEHRIYLQKRSKFKKENAGLYDKTIGAHVSAGETWELTVLRECAEELGFPATVLSEKEFQRAVKTTDLSIVALVRQIDEVSRFMSIRKTAEGEAFVQPYINAFFVGYYDGDFRFADGESSGIEVFSLDELKEEIAERPEKFTEDLKYMIKKYEKFLKPAKGQL